MSIETKYIRAKRLAPLLAIAEPTLWRWLKYDPTFPKPVRFSGKVTAWLYTDIEAWINAKKGA